MMKTEWKKKWLKALRSGEYKQGKNYLRKGDEFCCIGVLCDITGVHEWEPNGDMFLYGGRRSFVPKDVASLVRLRPSAPNHLMAMNDNDGADFYEIANWIEEHL